MSWQLRNEWGEPVSPEDPYGNAAGWTDGAGGVHLNDGTIAITTDYNTVRLPDELGGAWCAVVETRMVQLPDGRVGRYHTLAHPQVDCISLLNGDGALWVRKREQEKPHTCMDSVVLECEACAEEEARREEE